LNLTKRRLIKINSVTREILRWLDGKRTVNDIAREISRAYEMPAEMIAADVSEVLTELANQGVVRNLNRLVRIKDFQNMEETRYSINRDISCREEEPDGAILFNPETDEVKAINMVGLAIWQALEYPRKKVEVVEHLLDVCEGVPVEEVRKDVDEFIDQLKQAGFIGEVME
jgi:ribosomal protein L22